MTIDVYIPGEPVCQGRPRVSVIRGRGGRPILTPAGEPILNVRDPEKSRSWKGAAQVHMQRAMGDTPPLTGPLAVGIVAVHTCPKSDHRKSRPTPRRYHTKRGDADNLVKACLDAGNGVCWVDDAVVARVEIEKVIGAQGEAPHVFLRIERLPEEVPPDDQEEDQEAVAAEGLASRGA